MLQYHIQLSELYVLCMILVSSGSYGADYRYEACGPRKCANGPNISFPFYIQGQHDAYCGYLSDFMVSCSPHGFPVIPKLSGNEYVVEDIFYETQSFRVYNSAAFPSNNSSCIPRFRNTTFPEWRFGVADNVTMLNLFSNCTDSVSRNLSGNMVFCDVNDRDNRVLALYEKDGNITNAVENCETNLVAPVEDDGNFGMGNLTEVLRRGFVLNWTASDCSDCRESGGYCGFNQTDRHFKCFCPDMPHASRCIPISGKNRSLGIILGSGLGAILLVASILFLLLLIKRKKMKNAFNDKNIEVFLKHHGNLVPRRYKYAELKKMTKSFSDKLGQGGYGSVYKAKSQEGHLLAVKVLNEPKSNGEEFINEVASISRTSHVNIVSLLGFCIEGFKRALVYEFMPNGSLDKFIGNTSSQLESQLGWEKLFEIALGIARGLEYLHRGCQMQILHLDIKPHNILLDKDLQPKISDFGLAKLCPNRTSIISMSGTRGTVGYIAPEVFCRNFGNVSPKSDVYSYGMMLLDIVGEKENTDPGTQNTSEKYFPHWIYEHLELNGGQSLDDAIEEDECRMTKRKLTIVGLWCIQTDPRDRPSMSKVVEMLEGKFESLSIPPKPYLSSPPRLAADASFSESTI